MRVCRSAHLSSGPDFLLFRPCCCTRSCGFHRTCCGKLLSGSTYSPVTGCALRQPLDLPLTLFPSTPQRSPARSRTRTRLWLSDPIYLYADASNREHRPFLICNSAMFLQKPGSTLQLLAPVQSTPFITGVLGTPAGEDASGRNVGGGGVDTFGFNSACVSVSGSAATVAQTRQWSLADAVGTSSAFFAEVLQNLFHRWRQDPADLAALMVREADTILHWIRTKLPIEARGAAIDHLQLYAHPSLAQGPLLQSMLSDLQNIIPVINLGLCLIRSPARCRSPTASRMVEAWKIPASPRSSPIRTSTVSSPSSIHQCRCSRRHTVSRDRHGGFLPDTALVIDDSIPPLFGYQPYGAGRPGETEATCPTAAARPRGIRCMLTTRSSSKPPSQRFCRDFGARAAMGAM